METIHLEKNLMLFCITADSFPDGVPHAWHQLHKLLGETDGRTFYGLSYNDSGRIVYKAAVEEIRAGEAEWYGCERFSIAKGDYITEAIPDFPNQLCRINGTFQELLAHPGRAADAICLEWYQNERDLVCMVKQNEVIRMV